MNPWLENNSGIQQITDSISAISYFVIGGYLAYFTCKKIQHLPYPATVASIIMMLIFRGVIVLGRVLAIWSNDNVSESVALVSSLFAVYSACTISQLVLYFLKYKLPGEYKKMLAELQKELEVERLLSENIEHLIDTLEARIFRLEVHLKHKGWVDETNLELDVLKEQLETLKVKHDNAVICRSKSS